MESRSNKGVLRGWCALKVSARLPQIFFAEGEEGATKDTPLFIVNGAMSAKPGKGKGTWTLFRPLAQAAAQAASAGAA